MINYEQQQITIKEHIEELLNYIINSESSDWKGYVVEDEIKTLSCNYKNEDIVIKTDLFGSVFFEYNYTCIRTKDIIEFLNSDNLLFKALDKIRIIKIDLKYKATINRMNKFFGLGETND